MIPRRRDPIGLYLHIPFCDGKCPYCDFYSLPAGSRTMDDYCGRLISELFLWGEKCPRFVDTLYFGGGDVYKRQMVGYVGSQLMSNQKQVKKKASKAAHAVGNLIDDVQYIFKG